MRYASKQRSSAAMEARGKDLISQFDQFIIDVDGVLWLEGEALEGAPEALEYLRAKGKKLVFLTNKSVASREEIARKLQRAGIHIEASELITSAWATSLFLKERAGPSAVYAVGSHGFLKELRREGHRLTDQEAQFVAVGFVPFKFLSTEVLKKIKGLLEGGAELVACNIDKGNPLPDGSFSLGSYFVVRRIEEAVGKKALIVGKPYKPIFDIACRRFQLRKESCLLIGDSIGSDVVGGKNAGIRTALVLTGFTSPSELKRSEIKPDFVLPSLKDLLS